jgi:transposase
MAGGDRGYRRSLAIILRAKGMHPVDVAGMLGVTRRSIELWVKAYRAGA